MTNYNNLYLGLSTISNLSQNISQFFIDKNNGMDTQTAAQKASYNLSQGNYRIGYAYGMAQRTGNLFGHYSNQIYSYSDAGSNALANYSLALSNCSPWFFFNSGLCCGGCYGGYGMGYPGFTPYMC